MKRSLPKYEIPNEVSHVAKTLGDKGFEAYLVGGCVRDLLINKKPRDWDFTTNATPDQIIATFQKTFYENDYGTVGTVYSFVSPYTYTCPLYYSPFRPFPIKYFLGFPSKSVKLSAASMSLPDVDFPKATTSTWHP